VSDVLPTFLTFLFVAFAWIFFRAGTFSEAFDVIGGIFTLRPGPIDGSALALIGGILVLSFGIDLIQRAQSSPSESESSWSEWKHWPAVLQGSVYGLLLLGIVVFSGSPPVEFIYFQF
jgi:hypothetical protein